MEAQAVAPAVVAAEAQAVVVDGTAAALEEEVINKMKVPIVALVEEEEVISEMKFPVAAMAVEEEEIFSEAGAVVDEGAGDL